MKAKEMASLSLGDLRKRENELRKELMSVRFDHAVGKLLDTASPKRKRKELARLLTFLNKK